MSLDPTFAQNFDLNHLGVAKRPPNQLRGDGWPPQIYKEGAAKPLQGSHPLFFYFNIFIFYCKCICYNIIDIDVALLTVSVKMLERSWVHRLICVFLLNMEFSISF